MLTLDEIRQKLQDRRLVVVAKRTQISYQTLLKIREGDRENPSFKTIKTLSDYLERT